ncbi:ABC transporter ATP-binding protein [Micromonospora sp. LOL_015]|uniref:ABC transporter ATP-binding protein n=1 Tax=Micromonospora sp. LOL_015 TaxID=3345416 RepID=UPI003A84D852
MRRADLAVYGGEMVAIVGSSGSGKSTVLNIMGLLDEPTSGQVRLAGVETVGLADRERSHLRAIRIGFVFQAFHLVPQLDCLQNVMLPLVHLGVVPRLRRELAEAVLERVGLAHRLSAHPTTLSGGEQQRVAVARALVHEPPILLCDEPTGNLDRANSQVVLELLRGLIAPTRVVVVVTHEDRVRRYAHRAVEVIDGQLG